jgi:hypothetical protein
VAETLASTRRRAGRVRVTAGNECFIVFWRVFSCPFHPTSLPIVNVFCSHLNFSSYILFVCLHCVASFAVESPAVAAAPRARVPKTANDQCRVRAAKAKESRESPNHDMRHCCRRFLFWSSVLDGRKIKIIHKQFFSSEMYTWRNAPTKNAEAGAARHKIFTRIWQPLHPHTILNARHFAGAHSTGALSTITAHSVPALAPVAYNAARTASATTTSR